MPNEVKLPDVGEGLTEAEIVKWKVKKGDKIKEHETLCEIETDKAIVEIPSPFSGTILELRHKEGDTVKVGEALALIGKENEKIQEIKPEIIKPKKNAIEKETKTASISERKTSVVGSIPETVEELTSQSKEISEILATPATRRLARELQIDITKIKGTGKDGRITEEDTRKISQAKEVPQLEKEKVIRVIKKYDVYGYVDRVPLKGIRKATSGRMMQAIKNQALVTTMDEVDVTELSIIREKERLIAEKKKIKLTFLPFIIKAIVAGLKELPIFASELDQEHEEIIVKKYYNIGIAVATDDGLVVPVLKGADQKSILHIAQEIQQLAEKARSRKIDLADLKGSSFSITNYGSIGGIFGNPIPNYPDSAILGIGKIQEKPIVRNNKIEIRKILPLSFTFDHRVTDGAQAAEFMNIIKQHLEDPGLLLVE